MIEDVHFLVQNCLQFAYLSSLTKKAVGLSPFIYTFKITIFVSVKSGAISWKIDTLPKTV